MSSAVTPMHKQVRLRTRVAVFACIAVVLIGLDQASKYLAVATLSGGQKVEIIPRFLSLRLIFNPGATLGIGSGFTWIIGSAAAVACVIIFILVFHTASLQWTVALAIAFAGAGGNLIDRIVRATSFLNGTVIDFLDYGWSIGNVADVFLSIAAIMIVVLVFRSVPFGTSEQTSVNR